MSEPKDDSLGLEESLNWTPVQGVPLGAAWSEPIADLSERIRKSVVDGRKKREALEERLVKIERRLITIAGENGDNGKIGNLEEKMDGITAVVSKIEISAEKTAESAAGWWKWAIGIAIPIVILVVGSWIANDRRIAVVEVHVDSNREKIREVDAALDRIDERLDAIGDRIGVRPAAAAATTGTP